jgi:hypothetical protein
MITLGAIFDTGAHHSLKRYEILALERLNP